MRNSQRWKKNILLLTSVLVFVVFVKYNWWWLGSFSEFKVWYRNYGIIIWIFKIVIFIIWFFFTIRLIYQGYIKYPIFFFYVIIALIVKNQHPFSNLAVYDTFPENSYLFYIEDQYGNVFNHGINYQSADLVDVFDTYSKDMSVELDENQLSEIGKKILNITKNKNNYKGTNCYKLIRIKNYLEDKKLTSLKQMLYNECD